MREEEEREGRKGRREGRKEGGMEREGWRVFTFSYMKGSNACV